MCARASKPRPSRGIRSVGRPRGSRRSNRSRRACSRITTPRSRTVVTSRKRSAKATAPTSSSEALHASPSPSPESALDWMILVASWPSSLRDLLDDFEHDGSSGKTSPACSLTTADERSARSSGSWPSAGMGSPTEFSTLKASEFPSVVVASSLSAILETGDHLRPFYLSARACEGILRRAKKRGRKLPAHLQAALQAVVLASEPTKPPPGT